MSRFNRNPVIPPRTPDTHTAQGGEGFTRGPKDELFVLGLANFVDTDTAYETGRSRDDRFASLVRANATTDPEWTRAFIGWLRSEGFMRTAPIVAAAEYVACGAPNGRQLVASVLQRPDEPGELLGYWMATHGRAIPKPIKRGISDALPRLYNERNVLRYDGTGNAIRFGDVIEMTHAKPLDAHQSALYKHLIDRRHGRANLDAAKYRLTDGDWTPEAPLRTLVLDAALTRLPADQRRAHLAQAVECGWDWQRIGGWVPGGMDAQAWAAAIPNMGLMALVRNLRNFDEKNISPAMVAEVERRLRDPEEVRKSRQFPLRFLTAWKNVASMRWGPALEQALNHSLANVPVLGGRTLVLIDVSGSMQDVATTRRTDGHASRAITPQRWEVASLFGYAIAQRALNADAYLFDADVRAKADIRPVESILRVVEDTRRFVGGGTDTFGAIAKTFDGHDRVIIITDEQTGPSYRGGYGYGHRGGWDLVEHIKVPVYTWNLAGYRVGHQPFERNWFLAGGLSDAAFKVIPLLEARHRNVWPWEAPEAG